MCPFVFFYKSIHIQVPHAHPFEQGCCSLCARVCHAGHDIGYSRKSSFFCDCGAEVATAVEENRTPCKCLSAVPDDTMCSLCGVKVAEPAATTTTATADDDDEVTIENDFFATLMSKNFPSQCKESLLGLATVAGKESFHSSLLKLLEDKEGGGEGARDEIDFASIFGSVASTAADAENPDLTQRIGKALMLRRLTRASMIAMRAAKSSSIQCRSLSSAPHSNQGHSSRKARNGLSLRAMAADDR